MPETPAVRSSGGLPDRTHTHAALSDPMNVYHYSPLNYEAQEIRILRLLPGTLSADIRVCLETTRLAQDFVPDFEALSYAWGSTEDPVEISIGESGTCTLAVTRNLAEALPFLRYENKTRALWVDAICVNQQDTAERSSQVRRMADIYSKAARVLIWLGPSSFDSSVALDCLKLVSSKITVNWINATMSPLSNERHWADPKIQLPFDAEEFLAICNLLNRDWFGRLWIWQEARLAKNATILCGTESIPWAAVRSVVFCLGRKLQPYHFFDNMLSNRRDLLIRLCDTRGSVPFLNLIDDTKYSLCSDNRDRIFALLSMLDKSEESLHIVPDYTKTPLEVYQEIVVRHIKHWRKLNLVTSVERQEHMVGEVSWVPNWSVLRNTTPIVNGLASGSSMSWVAFKDDRILQVAGIAIATIRVTENFSLGPCGSQTYGAFALGLKRMAEQMDLEGFVNESSGNLRELARVLCSNDFSSQMSQPTAGYPSLSDSETILQAILKESFDFQGHIEYIYKTYLDCVATYCYGRSLFRSTNGHIGLGPEGAKPGDLITAWLGCDSVMILRPTGSGQYLVIGEAYCSGVMDGSAFLGPLPDSVEKVARYAEGLKFYLPTFINRESGKLYVEDPRLEGVPLPEGWRKEEHANEEYFPWFVNDSTGEDNGYFDPRLSVEALGSRGVKLQVFDLI
ncbi:HET-domain-containing protein [Hyaloscypha variabilis F]|uniref:HET-domain-containing protein n=1 Tax=Hyaloscypha variabilis (strain UAMH 11265 / GT02V1 / F) TaxID=1149755 RepID=A0A2J6R7S0_HYAVF|nr:HET-domain-containing protein [Hyaloscypha variabilis F]